MTAWRYIKGDEKDFAHHATDVNIVSIYTTMDGLGFYGAVKEKEKILDDRGYTLLARRELVTSVNDDRLVHDMGLNPKYNRPCKGITIDVYDVLKAFNVTCPALQHLIKKALAVGQRGHKDASEDLKDILASAKRAIELSESNK